MTKPIRVGQIRVSARLYGEHQIVRAVLEDPEPCSHCGAPSGQYCRGGRLPVFCSVRVTRVKQSREKTA
jgi:hypothetical protein